jgi:GT2 family glycosyltransferase
VIVNHNAGWLLFDCLRSALAQAAEVVLVDNASDPRRFEPVLARLGAQPRLHVIRAAENRGFAVGCNLGARRATQPLVLLLNPDCVPGPGSLARLCAAIGRQPRTAMVGGLLTYADGREQGGGRRAVPTPWRSFVRAFGLARLSRRWPKLFDEFHLHEQPLPATSISACGPAAAAGRSCSCPTRRSSTSRAAAAGSVRSSWSGTSTRAWSAFTRSTSATSIRPA